MKTITPRRHEVIVLLINGVINFTGNEVLSPKQIQPGSNNRFLNSCNNPLRKTMSLQLKKRVSYLTGDSTLNNISEKSLSKTYKVRVINFPGGSSEKITDQLDDLIKGKPHDLIGHVGTNDIAINVNLLNSVKKNFREVSKDSPSTQLAFSSVIVRKDKKNLEKGIIETNARLKNYCSEKGLGFIENNGIREVHLGEKRLHLNKNVNSALAKNLLRYTERKE